MPPHAVTSAVGHPSEVLSRNQLLELFYYARLTRDVEERLAILREAVLGSVARTSRALVLDTPVPYSPPLERAFMPGADKVVDAVRRLVRY